MKSIIFRLLNSLYSLYVILVFALFSPLVVCIYALLNGLPDEKRMRVIYRVHRIWVDIWSLLTGIRVRLSGHANIARDQSYVIVSNHCNMLAILFIGASIQHYWKPLIKSEFLKIPVMRHLFKAISITVDRNDPKSRRKSYQAMKQQLQAGVSILIFPEGTRNRQGVPLQRFHDGAFRLAVEAGVPILPIVLTHIRDLQPVGTALFYPGKGQMEVLAPISSEGKSATELKQEVFDVMETVVIAEQGPLPVMSLA